MTGSKLLDSSIWIDFAVKNNFQEIINSEETLFLSVLSLFEIKKKLIYNNIDKININKISEFIKKRSVIIQINEEIAEKAAEIAIENKIPAIDSLIYASALLNNLELLTLDNDFRDLSNVKIF